MCSCVYVHIICTYMDTLYVYTYVAQAKWVKTKSDAL